MLKLQVKFWSSLLLMVSCSLAAAAQTEPNASWKHSCYVYRDVNMNGVFDMGDKPYGNLWIDLMRPDGSETGIYSNIDGFANFRVSLGDKDAEIFEPGTYWISAVYPPGWDSLSSTHEQEYVFVEKSNVGGKLVPKTTCAPIGVAPILSIGARIVPAPGLEVEDYTITATGPDGLTHPIAFDLNGNLDMFADRGNWTLEFADPEGKTVYSRTVFVEYGSVELSTIDLGKPRDARPQGDVRRLGFDDLLTSDNLFEIPSGYGGLNWRNWIAVHNRFYSGAGYVNLTVSSEYVAYNSSGVPALVWSDKPFDFVGTYIGVAWPRGEEDVVTIKAWRGSELAYSDSLHLTDNGPIFFDADYRQITKLEISSGNYERIVLDDFQYSIDSRE